MKKSESDARTVLNQLGKLSAFLTGLEKDASVNDSFDVPLQIIRETMMFDVSVLYKVSNVIENRLILEVVTTLDPDGLRLDLEEGRKLRLFLDNRDKRYVNEVSAFIDKRISHINVPGMGCDIMGYVYLPESIGGAYLFGGDFCGKESSIKDFEVAGVEMMCNFISAILLKTQFKYQAEIDHLTGLFNSGKIKELVENIIKRSERNPDTKACIVMGDIDYFKKVNDSYGHIQGDIILKSVGDILSSSLRKVFDAVGRYGGEEFLIILDETNEDGALQIVERLRKKIEETHFEKSEETRKILKDSPLQITMSFGISKLTKESEKIKASDWIGQADNALYQSKQNGRNQTRIFKHINE